MVKTPLAMLRRLSDCPRQIDVAKRMGTAAQQIMNVESGRAGASDDFLSRLAKVLGRSEKEVLVAYLEGRKTYLRTESDRAAQRLAGIRAPARQAGRKSA
jgi:transcriptional regulator with XRE-family HTH domain